jgi:hypothetical protein
LYLNIRKNIFLCKNCTYIRLYLIELLKENLNI